MNGVPETVDQTAQHRQRLAEGLEATGAQDRLAQVDGHPQILGPAEQGLGVLG